MPGETKKRPFTRKGEIVNYTANGVFVKQTQLGTTVRNTRH